MHRVRADEASRLNMQDSLRSAAEAMETPNDTMLRLFNGVSAGGMFGNIGVHRLTHRHGRLSKLQ